MYRSMVDMQSATAEIRRGKKEEEETVEKYNVHICYARRPYLTNNGIFTGSVSSLACDMYHQEWLNHVR